MAASSGIVVAVLWPCVQWERASAADKPRYVAAALRNLGWGPWLVAILSGCRVGGLQRLHRLHPAVEDRRGAFRSKRSRCSTAPRWRSARVGGDAAARLDAEPPHRFARARRARAGGTAGRHGPSLLPLLLWFTFVHGGGPGADALSVRGARRPQTFRCSPPTSRRSWPGWCWPPSGSPAT